MKHRTDTASHQAPPSFEHDEEAWFARKTTRPPPRPSERPTLPPPLGDDDSFVDGWFV